jgi:hypothetical protein
MKTSYAPKVQPPAGDPPVGAKKQRSVEELSMQAAQSVDLPGAEAVARLMDRAHVGDAWGTAPHRDDVHAAARWLGVAVTRVHDSAALKSIVRALIACESFTLCLRWSECFQSLMDNCTAQLQGFGQALHEEMFVGLRLADNIGLYDPPLWQPPPSTPGFELDDPPVLRQDLFLPLLPAPTPAEAVALRAASSPESALRLATLDAETACIHGN